MDTINVPTNVPARSLSREEIRAYLLKRSDEMLAGQYQTANLTDQSKQILMAERAFWQFSDDKTLDHLIDYLKLVYPK